MTENNAFLLEAYELEYNTIDYAVSMQIAKYYRTKQEHFLGLLYLFCTLAQYWHALDTRGHVVDMLGKFYFFSTTKKFCLKYGYVRDGLEMDVRGGKNCHIEKE